MRLNVPLFALLGSLLACSGGAESADDDDVMAPQTAGAAGAVAMPVSTAGGAGTMAVGGAANGGAPSTATTGGGANAGAPHVGDGGKSTGGTLATAGAAGAAGATGNAGAAGGPGKKQPPSFAFPSAVGPDQKLTQTREVSDFDGKLARFVGSGDLGGSGQAEGQDPLFRVKAGGSLKNVILGAPAADGVHCEGSCTIENVWWEDVGEDAITLDGGNSSNVYRITNSGARKASDKVIQHNGAGTLFVLNFLVEDFGKLYRSCGNCGTQYQRHAEFDTIVANGKKSVLAGVNQGYKDSAKLVNVFADLSMKICERFDGNDSGKEPKSLGSGADGTYCIYSAQDITWH